MCVYLFSFFDMMGMRQSLRTDYRADALIYIGRESALDKTSVKERHMYITEAHFSPNTSKAMPGG